MHTLASAAMIAIDELIGCVAGGPAKLDQKPGGSFTFRADALEARKRSVALDVAHAAKRRLAYESSGHLGCAAS